MKDSIVSIVTTQPSTNFINYEFEHQPQFLYSNLRIVKTPPITTLKFVKFSLWLMRLTTH